MKGRAPIQVESLGVDNKGLNATLDPACPQLPPASRRARHSHAGLRGLALAFALVCAMLADSGVFAWDQDRMLAAAQRTGPGAVAGVRALQTVLVAAQPLDDLAKLAAINDFFNRRIVFRDDQEVWNLPDYWASPLETLNQGQGDCEDYAVAKYFSLLALGVPTAKLRLVYVRAEMGGPGGAQLPHMVLAYYGAPGAEPMILDNLIGELRSASRRSDLTPVFSFNSEGLWQGVGGASAGDPVARLSRWRGVLAKTRTEGFE